MTMSRYSTHGLSFVEIVKDRALMLDDGQAALIALAIEQSDGADLPSDCDALLEWVAFEVGHLPEVMPEGGFVAKDGPRLAAAKIRDLIATLDTALRAARQIEHALIDDIEQSERENGGAR